MYSSIIKPYLPDAAAWIVSCYYNPLRFKSRRRNFEIFRRQLGRSKINFLIVECAFGDDEFELEPQTGVLRVRSRDVLWQKERLLNLAEKLLPAAAEYIIWLDADVLFVNQNWIIETVAALHNNSLCQPFARCVRLGENQIEPDETNSEIWESFASVWRHSPEKTAAGNFDAHGHTGFAWAARREVFREIGLYDTAIAGTSDHLMAHAALGQFPHSCIDKAYLSDNLKDHFADWARKFAAVCGRKIGCVSGDLWHLWHGQLKNRRYLERTQELSRIGFDPAVDLKLNEDGLYEFAAGREDLRVWMKDYFRSRLEDEAAIETD